MARRQLKHKAYKSVLKARLARAVQTERTVSRFPRVLLQASCCGNDIKYCFGPVSVEVILKKVRRFIRPSILTSQ